MKTIDQSLVLSRIRDIGKIHLTDGSHILLYGSRARGSARPDSDWEHYSFSPFYKNVVSDKIEIMVYRFMPKSSRNKTATLWHFSFLPLQRKQKNAVMKDFAAIDFETANQYRSSVCSVGVVIVRDGHIKDSFYSLIHPEPDFYSWRCQQVHGLTSEDTADAEACAYIAMITL